MRHTKAALKRVVVSEYFFSLLLEPVPSAIMLIHVYLSRLILDGSNV